jgi:hypothetical protein
MDPWLSIAHQSGATDESYTSLIVGVPARAAQAFSHTRCLSYSSGLAKYHPLARVSRVPVTSFFFFFFFFFSFHFYVYDFCIYFTLYFLGFLKSKNYLEI